MISLIGVVLYIIFNSPNLLIKIAHAIIVMDLDSDWVEVCDPLQGDCILPRSTFDSAWAMMRNLVILIQ